MRKLLTFIVALLILCYPFAVYFGINHLSPRYFGLAIAILFSLRLLLLKKSNSKSIKIITILIAIIGITVSLLASLSNSAVVIKLYPCAVSLLLLGIFGYTLYQPPSLIEKLARLTTKDLPPEAISYTYKVTIVWCVFFTFNAAIAFWTALFSSMKTWTFYNGFLSYILIGSLFAIEWIIRQFIKRQFTNHQSKHGLNN